jgi:hypothetical protein
LYALAEHFCEWNVEQEGGLIYRIEYEQYCTWLAYNQLDPFLSERDDWRSASIVNMIHNVNTTKVENLTSVSDWMPKSVEQRLEEEEQEEIKKREAEQNESNVTTGWDDFKTRLIASGRPVQTTFKG